MYNPAPFREDRPEVLFEFIRQHPLGTLITAGPEVSHLPFFPDESARTLRCHLARANPHAAAVSSGADALVVFLGAGHYISPSWYPSKAEHGRVVPTWNYAAVHVCGQARQLSRTELRLHLEEITNHAEAGFEMPWRVSDAPEDFISGLAQSIVGVEIAIATIEGKFKLSQNRSVADREGAIAGLEAHGSPGSLLMARTMKARRRSTRATDPDASPKG